MSEQGTVRRRIAATAIAVGVVLFGIAVAPGVASAHTPNVSDDCGGLSVTLTNYEGPSANNQVVVTIDGVSQSFNFGTSFVQTFTWSPAVDHSWSVVIDANRNTGNATEFDKTFSGKQVACNPTTSTTTTTTTTTLPETTSTLPDTTSSTSTLPESTTTTTTQAPSLATTSVAQEGPTSSVDQSGGAATTTEPVGGSLPATGGSSTNLTVIALTLIGIGAVMLRLTSKPTR